MKKLIKSIDEQIISNRNKNIFTDNMTIFRFVDETVKAISLTKDLDADSAQYLIDYTTDKAIEEFCRVNQYYAFSSKSRNKLRNIYVELFMQLNTKPAFVQEISDAHYHKLKQWLLESNPFAEKVYANGSEKIKPVICSEYSPELQIEILQIDVEQLISPVLDIGCGSKGILVNHLRKSGIEAYGIDRFRFNSPVLTTADWLEYEYGVKKWGIIISNLGFSNHFNHHHLREDGNYAEYGKVYMQILHSLKVGGSFHYAPDLPFIEQYLDKNEFAVNKNNVDVYDVRTSIIRRLC